MIQFDTTYRSLPAHLFSDTLPTPVKDPQLLLLNRELLAELGLEDESDEGLLGYLSGNRIPEGATPIAQAYAGHQFGHLAVLGDGRAVLLGEIVTPDGTRVDLQLKGAGRTPYSRGGDGRGTLYSMLREYLISGAMDALGIATTKSLGGVG